MPADHVDMLTKVNWSPVNSDGSLHPGTNVPTAAAHPSVGGCTSVGNP